MLGTTVSLYWKSIIVVVLATGAWVIVPLGMFFRNGEGTSSQFPVYLLTCSVLLAVISLYVGYILRFHASRMVKTGRVLAKVYLQITGLLVALAIVLSYTGK